MAGRGHSAQAWPGLIPMLQIEEQLEVLQGVGLMQRLVMPNAQHAWKTHGYATLVATAAVDALEAELEDQRWLDAAHRPELLDRRPPDDGVDLAELLVGEPGIGLDERDQLQAFGPRRLLAGDGLEHRIGFGLVDRLAVPDG